MKTRYGRDMHFGYRFYDALDVWNWLNESSFPVELLKAKRHPQGYAVSLWNVTWDGAVHLCRLKAWTWTYAYSDRYPYTISKNFNKDHEMRDAALSLIGPLLPQNALGYAQAAILSGALWAYIRTGDFNHRMGIGGSGRKGLYVNYDNQKIKVRIGEDDITTFTTQSVINSIKDQIVKPQQLVLF